ncbi:hypothetical protein [Pseudomonas sp. NMI795_08]|uniref:hypothetical protein n=1 Tax=Pseudomonas sp. NMI795_08 TaxID=2903144 RepID=UPI001E5A4689|nr:hypothetical protein [Pseudomonas sp. NMI795_08]MCE1119081.1 hypothetical protein [Pseudomonas sp. NMI795_08]
MVVSARKPSSKSTKGDPLPNLADRTEGRHDNTDRPAAGSLVPFNFAVPAEFKKAYKVAAAELDMSMVDVLKESFELFKRQHGLK